jgi:hypothetical protein
MSADCFNSNKLASILNQPGVLIQNSSRDHCRVARVKPAPILAREFATPAYRKASVLPGLKERYRSDARHHWNTGLVGCFRQCAAPSA